MCHESHNSCPAIKLRNKEKALESYKSGKRLTQKELYQSFSDEVKNRMAWNRGLTKYNNESVKAYADKLRGRPGVSRPVSQETREKMSRVRTLWLKNTENRANLGRHRKSWMEVSFETYLKDLPLCYETEKHFWSPELNRNFYVDFIFEDKKLIIELDGTQHRLTIEKDKIRDEWFSSKGYRVVRIDIYEFRKRLFSGIGFLDILGC